MTELPQGLVAWAELAGPSIVLDGVRSRARRGFTTERGQLRATLTRPQRTEVARLLGTPWDVSGRPVRLEYLARALAEHKLTVREFVERLDGEALVDERTVRAEEIAAAASEREEATGLVITSGVDAAVVQAWLADPGLPRAGSGALLRLVERVIGVLGHLPVDPPMRLARLAATVSGDAHALDYGRTLGRAVARLIALVHDLPRPMRAGRDWRRAWSAAGVRCDGVSSRVLALNLPLIGAAPAVTWSAAAPGEPVWLSLRSITGAWSAPLDARVFVCENVTVLEAAADELGRHCPPLICTDGLPHIAALDLVGGLAAAGCEIAVRADVDDAGFVVVDQVCSVAPAATLWRFDAPTYVRYAGLKRAADLPLRDLYTQHRVVLHEETLLDQLIADLADGV